MKKILPILLILLGTLRPALLAQQLSNVTGRILVQNTDHPTSEAVVEIT